MDKKLQSKVMSDMAKDRWKKVLMADRKKASKRMLQARKKKRGY